MIQIPLLRRVGGSTRYPHTLQFAVVGHTTVDDHRAHLASFRWVKLTRTRKDGSVREYAVHWVGPGKTLLLHRVIGKELGFPSHLDIDHRDGDGLNNLDSNLRPVTNSQNQANKRKQPGTSIYKGVYWHKRDGKWQAKIKLNQKETHLGLFSSEIEAARAYDSEARRLFGPYARLNFPNE